MPARTRTAALTLLAAVGAALVPATGAFAAEGGHRDHPGGHRPVVSHERLRESPRESPREHGRHTPLSPLHRTVVQQRPQEHPAGAAAKDRPATTGRGQAPVTQREHRGGVSRPAAPARPPAKDAVEKRSEVEKRPAGHRQAASNPVRRMVQAGQTVKSHHDVGGPLVAGTAALLAVGGGAYGVRLLGRRRAAGRADG
ncbi:hypothetical protein [Streptomyces caatingaensis]|uniref:Uncharacterized protein n=1 Tax=Streptomyces caatingaensis TaxID=1678637 RepID=A0A0K9XHV2_9ACTN|nr:hypothetical protein [Streptomyces caatingaensis]KNB52641.1 hypothetical protein AC230_08245 [Streptomyces caatingaensis]